MASHPLDPTFEGTGTMGADGAEAGLAVPSLGEATQTQTEAVGIEVRPSFAAHQPSVLTHLRRNLQIDHLEVQSSSTRMRSWKATPAGLVQVVQPSLQRPPSHRSPLSLAHLRPALFLATNRTPDPANPLLRKKSRWAKRRKAKRP